MTGFLSIFLRSYGGLPAGAPLLRGRSLSLHWTQPIRLVAHFRAHRLHDRRIAFTRSSMIGEEQVLCDHVCGATTWMELGGKSRAAGNVSKSLGVQGMATGQASPMGSQRTPRTGPEGSSPLYRGTATAEEGPGRAGRV